MAGVALFLAREIKSLIVAETADPKVQAGLAAIIGGDVGTGKPVRDVNEQRTMHLGHEDVRVTASVNFQDYMTAKTVEEVTQRLQPAITARYRQVRHLFIEVQSQAAFASAHRKAAGVRI